MCVKNGRCCLCSRIACAFCFRLKVLLHFGHPMRWFRSRVAVNLPTIHDRSCENRSIRASTYVLATSAANHGAISTQVDASAARITVVHRTAVIFRIDRVPSRTGSAIPNLRSPRVSESPQPERCGICGQVCRSGYQEIFRALSPRNSPERTPVSHRSCRPL